MKIWFVQHAISIDIMALEGLGIYLKNKSHFNVSSWLMQFLGKTVDINKTLRYLVGNLTYDTRGLKCPQ